MASDVTLSSSIRSNLLTLQNTSKLVDRTNARLSSRMKVASAVDDAVAYFQAKGLSDRASDLSVNKDNVDQAISSVKSAMGGLESAEKILTQMKGVVLSAKSSTAEERADLKEQYSTLAKQLNELIEDTSYQGLNLINSTGSNLKVEFSERSSAYLDVAGVDVHMSKLITSGSAASSQATKLAGAAWSTVSSNTTKFDDVLDSLASAVTTVKNNTKTLGTNIALLNTRLDFTSNYINNLTEGSGKLTLADLNEEGANLVSLQTSQQLGIQALSFAGQQEQGVLKLFG